MFAVAVDVYSQCARARLKFCRPTPVHSSSTRFQSKTTAFVWSRLWVQGTSSTSKANKFSSRRRRLTTFKRILRDIGYNSFSSLIPHLQDTTGCQTSWTTGWTPGWLFVYTMQPVVQPVWQPVVSCKRGLRDSLIRFIDGRYNVGLQAGRGQKFVWAR